MSLKITRDGVRGLYILEPEGPPGDPISLVTTDSIDEIGAAIAHYFGTKEDRARHLIYKRRGLCPLCEAMKAEVKTCPKGILRELAGKANKCLAGGPKTEEYPGGQFCEFLCKVGSIPVGVRDFTCIWDWPKKVD